MSKPRILILDDEKQITETLYRILWRDYEVVTEINGVDAIEKVKNNKFAVIITDQKMPDMTGIEFLEQTILYSPHSIRILLTAFSDIDATINAINRGQVYRYITKPFNNEEIKLTIKNAVAQYETNMAVLQLNKELHDKNFQLLLQNEALKKLDEQKRSFITIATHELKTPITLISAYIQLILSDEFYKFSEEQKKIFNLLYESNEWLNRVVNDIIEIVQLDSNKKKLNITKIRLPVLLSQVINSFEPFLKKRNLSLLLEGIDELPEIYQDDKSLLQVFTNLLSNAIKFTQDNGIIKIRNILEKDESYCHIVISDNGIGIPSEELEKIFDKFYTLGNYMHHSSSTTNFLGGGLGLGLSICKGIINELKGKIWAESQGLGKGSDFHVIIPVNYYI